MSESPVSSWYRLDLSGLPRGVVAVDATPAAAALWFGPVASVLEEIAEKLPKDAHPEVAFLGDRRTYPLEPILRGLAAAPPPSPAFDIAAQLGRAPVLGPLLWELSRQPPRPLLVLANSPILDAEDWAGSDPANRTLIYRVMSSERVAHPAFHEVGPDIDLAVLVEHLRDPMASVRIGHPAAFALDWTHDDFQWADGALSGTAIAEASVQFLHPPGVPPEAVVTMQSGAVHRWPLAKATPPAAAAAIPLTPAEANVLNLWRRGSGFWCGHCSRSHAPGKLWCAGRPNAGGLFPSLIGTAALAVRLAARGNEWTASPIPRGIAVVGDGAVSVTRPGAAAEYHFEEGQWLASEGDPGTFLALDSDCCLARCGPATAALH